MKGRVRFGPIRFEAEIDSEDSQVQEHCQQIIDNAAEQIESAIAETVCRELKLILPGITAECAGTWLEDEE